jgi:uncharacterized repeat protein (TIGR02543 family)
MALHRTRRARATASFLVTFLALGCGGESTSSDAAEQLIAAAPTFSVAVRRSTGGTISSATGGVLDGKLDCGTDGSGADACDAVEYASSETVTLVVTPDPGYEFAGWYADCGGTEPTCTLEVGGHAAERVAAASFRRDAWRWGVYFLVTVSRPTGGVVVSADHQILCGSAAYATACGPALYRWEQVATLSVVAEPEARFVGWAGDCSGSGDICTLDASALPADKAVTALFDVRTD